MRPAHLHGTAAACIRGMPRALRSTAAACIWSLAASYAPLAAQGHPAAHDTLIVRELDLPILVQRGNPAVRAARSDAAIAAGDVTSARLRPNPELDVNADILPIGGGEKDPNGRQYGLQLAFPIERGNKRAFRTDASTRLQLLAEQRLDEVFQQQLRAARLAWVDLVSAQAAQLIGEGTLNSYEQLATLSRARLDARQISEAELARILVERGRAAVALEAQRTETEAAQSALLRLFGIETAVRPADTLAAMSRDTTPAESLIEEALASRADVRAARQAIEAAEADQRLQDALARPDLSFSLDYSMQQHLPLYGASVSIPIARNNRNQGERQKAAVRLAQARDDLARAEREVRLDVRQALAIADARSAALARFGSGADGILDRAQAARTAAEFAYRNGATSLIELLDAERSYGEVQRAYVDAVADLNRSLIDLRFVTGLIAKVQP